MTKNKPANAQCTDCSVDEPYDTEIIAGGVLCGGCGRRRPGTKYILASQQSAELQAKVEGLEREVERLKGLLYNITTAGSIDQHTKDYTWQQFKTDNQL